MPMSWSYTNIFWILGFSRYLLSVRTRRFLLCVLPADVARFFLCFCSLTANTNGLNLLARKEWEIEIDPDPTEAYAALAHRLA